MGGTAKPALEGILKALVSTAEPLWPINWEDPIQFAHGQLAAADLAFTQGDHGSESRTGEIMEIIASYGKAGKPVIPALRKVIENFNRDTVRGDFPPSLNLVRVGAIEETIRAIETATTQPELRSIKR